MKVYCCRKHVCEGKTLSGQPNTTVVYYNLKNVTDQFTNIVLLYDFISLLNEILRLQYTTYGSTLSAITN